MLFLVRQQALLMFLLLLLLLLLNIKRSFLMVLLLAPKMLQLLLTLVLFLLVGLVLLQIALLVWKPIIPLLKLIILIIAMFLLRLLADLKYLLLIILLPSILQGSWALLLPVGTVVLPVALRPGLLNCFRLHPHAQSLFCPQSPMQMVLYILIRNGQVLLRGIMYLKLLIRFLPDVHSLIIAKLITLRLALLLLQHLQRWVRIVKIPHPE